MATQTLSRMDVFEAACNDPYAEARKARAKGQKVAGITCTYTPEELFHAAGYLPVRVMAREGGTPRADEIIQSYSCSFARSVLDRALAGEFDFADLIVFSHTCDTMQNLADLWRGNRPGQEVIIVSGPTLIEGDAARVYFRKEMDRVRERLEALVGPIPDAAIVDSIRLYAQRRALMRRLYTLRRQQPDLLPGVSLYYVVTSAFIMPVEDHLRALRVLVEELEAETVEAPSSKPRVLVAGSVCQDRGFTEAIEQSGCILADDDLCMGGRAFELPDPNGGGPMEALVQMYLTRTPCPAFHRPGFDPGTRLLERARAARANGVIYLLTKFCDPWAFDYPHLKNTLEAAGIPTLLLEVEQNLPLPEQLRTRIEAFVEMLESKAAAE